MEIIPVIDLMAGQAVHARQGRRESYGPLDSQLCAGSDPLDVVRGYLSVHPFGTLYIADLDAIRKLGHNGPVVQRLGQAFPDLRLWVDQGLSTLAPCRDWLGRGLGDLVLGSETLAEAEVVGRLTRSDEGRRVVLSLDFRDEAFLGPPAVLERQDLWPERVIVMTLARVGAGQGPDVDRLQAVARHAGKRRLYAAGGLRGADDLSLLADLGVSGVLVASALHDRRLGPAEIAAAAGR
jgi:phosphoribosylformimino-5-aminoimidazole carboxamide ribotide isomerase